MSEFCCLARVFLVIERPRDNRHGDQKPENRERLNPPPVLDTSARLRRPAGVAVTAAEGT